MEAGQDLDVFNFFLTLPSLNDSTYLNGFRTESYNLVVVSPSAPQSSK